MKKILLFITIGLSVSCASLRIQPPLVIEKPVREVWCYDPVWNEGDSIGVEWTECQTPEGKIVRVYTID